MAAVVWAADWEAHDAWYAQVVGIPCTCDDSPWSSGSCDCPHHGPENERYCRAQQQAEIEAENAWLRAAEAPTADDYAFEQWEAARIDPAEYDRAYGPYA